MTHRECNDCGTEYEVEEDLKDMAVLVGGISEEQAEKQCPVCDSMNTEEVEK